MHLKVSRLIVALASMILVASLMAEAQQVGKVPRIGYLSFGRGDSQRSQYFREVFLQGLREFGWVEGQNLIIESRRAEEKAERLPDLAADLVRLPVDVIVAGGEQASLAAKQATSTIPIVMAPSLDPVATGLVTSLARPGGNITGLKIQAAEIGGKLLELLKEAAPQTSRVAVLWNAGYRAKALELENTQVAARALGVTLHSVEVRGPDDFDGAFAAIAGKRPDALITSSDPLTLNHQRRIVDFATQHRLPMISEQKEFAVTGSLMSYGASLPDLQRRAAYYVDRILRGAKPGDLPVEQPIKYELVINLKTAKALGLTMPPSLLVQVDEVLQ